MTPLARRVGEEWKNGDGEIERALLQRKPGRTMREDGYTECATKMLFLQLVVGSCFDLISNSVVERKFNKALSLACFGIFPNIVTVVILLAAGVSSLFQIRQPIFELAGSKIGLVAILIGAIILLTRLRYRILAADRVRFKGASARVVFLLTYLVASHLALIGSFKLYSDVLHAQWVF
jgi:hypothetical protein